MQTTRDSHRVNSLDAVRGLAAMSVVVLHYLSVFPASAGDGFPVAEVMRALALSPLALIWAGQAAVLVFFVLSGCALTLMLRRPSTYSRYVTRRIIRLYIPYIGAVVLAAALMFLFPAEEAKLAPLNDWCRSLLFTHANFGNFAQHVLMIGAFNTDTYDFAIWSLVHEMRFSLVFPLLLLFINRFSWMTSLLSAFGFSCLCAVAAKLSAGRSPLFESLLTTGFYLIFFAVGALIALHGQRLARRLSSLNPWALAALVTASILGYLVEPWMLQQHHINIGLGIQLLRLPAAALLIVVALNSTRLSIWLSSKVFAWLGKVSYSLYLLHPVILIAGLKIFYPWVPLAWLLPLLFGFTLIVTELYFRAFEQPSIWLSRRIGTGIAPMPTADLPRA